MKHILVVTGSARPNSAGNNVVKLVETELEKLEGVQTEVVHADTLELPFFDAPHTPSDSAYEIPHQSVRDWSEKVSSADAVVWVMPEYNHSISGIQKNAIDWLYHEWTDKPLAIVAYGWHEGVNVLESVKLVLKVVKADLRGMVGFTFNKSIEIDGSAKDAEAIHDKLAPLMKALVA